MKRQPSRKHQPARPNKPHQALKGCELTRLYGHHAVQAALANPDRRVHRLIGTQAALSRLQIPPDRRDMPCEVVETRDIAALLAGDAVHQGVLLEAEPLLHPTLDEIIKRLGERATLLMLDQVTDPRNTGAILRSAAAFGIEAVIMPAHNHAELNPACAKAASGALDIVPVTFVTNLAQTLERTKKEGFWSIGLTGDAPTSLHEVQPFVRTVIVLGAEGTGLRRLVAERCDLLASLPIEPVMESLNVSVAAGIALYLLAHRARAK